MSRIPNPSLALPLLAATLPIAACGGGGGGGGGSGPATAGGTVLFLAAPEAPLVEQEPNDGFDAPTPAPALEPGRTLTLVGAVGGADARDGWALLARARSRVEVALSTRASGIELAVLDAVEQRVVASSAAGGARCTVEAEGAFDVVVRATGAGGDYALEVRALPREAAAPGRIVAPLAGSGATGDAAAALAGYLEPTLETRRGEFLVLPRPQAGPALDAVLAARGLRVVSAIPGETRLVAFDLPAVLGEAAALRATIARMRATSELAEVELAEPNRIRRALGGPTTPNDEFYPLQWHYPLIHLPEAWGIEQGDADVIVAVIDTGETAHPDLVARQIPGFDLITDPAIAGDGNGPDADPTDVGDGDALQPSSWHGTHVAGTVGASTDNSTGVAGVTWAGRIQHLRVLGLGGGTDFDIANAIRYGARLTNSTGQLPAERADVLNLSLGGPGSNSTVQSAVTAARAAGCTIFAAAGNNNSGVAFFPAAYNGVVSISAVDINSNKAPYSNFHATVDFCMPGGNVAQDLNGDGFPDGVLSTLLDEAGNQFLFGFYNGTSMACPHAAGVAALVLSADPGLDLTPNELEAILLQSAVDLGAAGDDPIFGNGLIDASVAVQIAANGGAANPILAVSPGALTFGATQTQATLEIDNAGGGLLDVGTITDTTVSPEDWLTVVAGPGNGETDVASLTVTVDRTGLADGVYQGNVAIQSNGGSRDVPVTMVVAGATPPVDVDLFVLAVELDTGKLGTLAQDLVNPTTGLDYLLADLPAGSYLIACGSDDDGDGFICGEGDVYCGLYPVINEPEPVDLSEGEDLSGLDFPVTASPGTEGASSGGFRRLR